MSNWHIQAKEVDIDEARIRNAVFTSVEIKTPINTLSIKNLTSEYLCGSFISVNSLIINGSQFLPIDYARITELTDLKLRISKLEGDIKLLRLSK